MEYQSSCKLESTNFWNIQHKESNISKSEIYGETTRKDSYIENLNLDPLLKVEAIITESQDDNVLENPSENIKRFDRTKNRYLGHNLVKEEKEELVSTESEDNFLSNYLPGNISLRDSQERVTNIIEKDISKNNIENKSDSILERERTEDLKNKIFDKGNYVDCPYKDCIMRIYTDHLEKHLHEHELNALNSKKKNYQQYYLCVECGCKYKVFESIATHIFSHFNPKAHEISDRKIYTQEAIRTCIQMLSESDTEIDINSDSSHEDYTPNNYGTNKSVIKNKKLEIKSIQCIYNTCGKICKDREYYDIHLAKFHNEISCVYCERLFQGSVSLNFHIDKNHKTSFTCRLCGETFQSSIDRTNHIKSLHKVYTPEKQQIMCEICGKSVASIKALEYHMHSLHSSTEVHYCDKCDFQSHTKLNVTRHWLRMHSNLKPVKCEICEKEFKNYMSRKKHMKFFHSSTSLDKPFECPNCDKAFKHANHLKRHLLLHSGIKPFGCTLCDYRTNQRSNVNVHMKSHRKQLSQDVLQLTDNVIHTQFTHQQLSQDVSQLKDNVINTQFTHQHL